MSGLAKDAAYVVKWNAPLAISWMEGIAGRFLSEYEKEVYNKSVIKINNYLDHLEKMRCLINKLNFKSIYTKIM